jgi:hypothetical protein
MKRQSTKKESESKVVGGFLSILKHRKKTDVDATKEEIEFLGSGVPNDEKEIKDINNTILDSLSIKETKHFQNFNNKSLNTAEKNRLKFRYKNGSMKIQDTNGIIYNPEV